MSNLKLSTRLTALIAFLSLIMIAIGAFGLYGMNESNRRFQTVYEERLVALGDLLEVQRLLLRNRNAVSSAVAIRDPAYTRSKHQEIEANIAELNKFWASFRQTRLTEEEARLADHFEAVRRQFLQGFLLPAWNALGQGDLQQVQQLLVDKDEALYAPLREDIVQLTRLQTSVAKAEYDAAQSLFRTVFAVAIGSIAAGVGLGALLGWSIIRHMSRSLHQAIHAADAVAAGDLSQRIDVRGRDEVARLLQALKTMQEGLRGVVQQVHQGSVSVASASSQIAQANQDLSARTESQASALQQTAASMEQLNSTVRQNADNAQMANKLALGASAIAEQGGQVVRQVVETMRGISDSSRQIADIINLIDAIAFQTNILALNAAVEAARAGEQGRGFAVVASEVRGLASRSADAAKQIKQLINDSSSRVHDGSALADQAGTTMAEVVEAIRRVTDLMGEISAASSEQSSGVAQIGEAVTQMDQATQQNSALVEEMAAAASSLRSQAGDLVRTVGAFRLDGAARPPEGAARLASPGRVLALG